MRARLLTTACSVAVISALPLAACGHVPRTTQAVISVDGSSTVYPLTEAIAEDFQHCSDHPRHDRRRRHGRRLAQALPRWTRHRSGLAADRRVRSGPCAAAGVGFVELPVAFDGITVAVHPSNTWVDSLRSTTCAACGGTRRKDVCCAGHSCAPTYPIARCTCLAPASTRAPSTTSRGDHRRPARQSRRLHVERGRQHRSCRAWPATRTRSGYFGFAYYEENHEYVRAVAIRADEAPRGAVLPTRDTIRSGAYRPLARPVFVYVNARSLDRADVRRFVDYLPTHVGRGGQRRRLRAARPRAMRRFAHGSRHGTPARCFTERDAVHRRDAGSTGWAWSNVTIGGARVVEAVIERALLACAALSVLVTAGIVGVLAWETIASSVRCHRSRFLTGTDMDAAVRGRKRSASCRSSPARCWSSTIAMVVALPAGC